MLFYNAFLGKIESCFFNLVCLDNFCLWLLKFQTDEVNKSYYHKAQDYYPNSVEYIALLYICSTNRFSKPAHHIHITQYTMWKNINIFKITLHSEADKVGKFIID